MKYIIIYSEEPGKLRVKQEIFTSLFDAEKDAGNIDISRNPTIVPYISIYPENKGIFTGHDFEELSSLVEYIRMILLYSGNIEGTNMMAAHHLMMAIEHISIAVQNLRMAALIQENVSKDKKEST